MRIHDQTVIPAARSGKDFEFLMKTDFEFVVLLDVYIAQLVYLRRMARDHGKKLLLHADLVQGLRNDEAGAQFLCQVIKPAGLISTHSNVVLTAKKHGLISIQRVFLLDSHSLETSYRIINASDPDYIEVLPGVMPEVIREISDRARRPVLAGGFIRSVEDVNRVLQSGASGVTTSSRQIWNHYARKGLKT
jgi:glycerol uptake operon antiterminator